MRVNHFSGWWCDFDGKLWAGGGTKEGKISLRNLIMFSLFRDEESGSVALKAWLPDEVLSFISLWRVSGAWEMIQL